MSCDIANGRLEACKDAISGLLNIYFINYGALNLDDVVYKDSGANSDVIDSWPADARVSLYKYELKGANGFEQTIQTSRDNGTTFFEQVLTVQLKKQDIATHKNVKLLAYGRPHIVIKNRNNQFFLAGLEHGMELTTATASNGTAMGDLNGYTLTFVGNEKIYANLIDCNTEATLATAFGSATIVTA
jgi:hypothetical protein